MTSAIRMASETIGERYQTGAESDNDPRARSAAWAPSAHSFHGLQQSGHFTVLPTAVNSRILNN